MRRILSFTMLSLILLAVNFSVTEKSLGQSATTNSSLETIRYKVNRLAPDALQSETRVVIDGGTKVSVEIITLIETVQTSILTPTGQTITPENVGNMGGSFIQSVALPAGEANPLFVIPSLTGNFHYIYEFPIQGQGEYRIIFQAPAGLNQQLPILTKVTWDSDIAARLIPTDPTPLVGKPTVISLALFKGSQPIVGATVQLVVRRPDRTRSVINLLDNGDGRSDDRVGDGVYSGRVTPTLAGAYSLVAIATGKIPGMKKFTQVGNFTRNSLGEINARAASSQFTGTIVNQGVDDNADGLFDRIEFRLGTQTVTSGQYQAFVELRTAGGHTMIGNGVATLTAGPGEIIANVPASVVRETNENGPYTIERIRLDQMTETAGSEEVDRRINLGQTLPYQLSQFQRPPLMLTGVFSEQPIDTNGNGKFDILRISLQVDVLTAGLYEWNMKLANSDAQDINFASATGSLVSGLNMITFDFDGRRIRRAESNGPYDMNDLLLFGPNSIVVTEVGSTQAYNYLDFEDGGPTVAIALSPSNATNLRIGQPHTVNVTVTQGTTPASSKIVTLRILTGPNAGFQASATTNASGSVAFTYTGSAVGTDTLRASVSVDDFLFNSSTATATWVNNSAPLCALAAPSISLISPPDNRFVPVTLTGLSDPDGDPLVVSIMSIRQDEPTNHQGANPNTPDGQIQGGTALIKAERIFGTVVVNGVTYVGNGRVYHIGFVADDGRGGQCLGTATVGVPHVRTATPVDGGPLFDSTVP